MSVQRKIALFLPKVEKGLFILIFLTIALGYLISGKKEDILWVKAGNIGLILLGILYLFSLKNYIIHIILAFVMMKFLYVFTGIELIQKAGIIGFVIAGIYFIIKAIKESLKVGGFELLIFLMGFFLMIPGVVLFTGEVENLEKLYTFGSAFVIATIIYSDNLWLKFNLSEKKLITFIFVAILTEVLRMSLKMI